MDLVETFLRLTLRWIVFIAVALSSNLSVAQDCYESSISSPTPFMGNNDEIFRLTDGSLWQVKHEYSYLYEYYPNVLICPSLGKVMVGSRSLNVQQVGNSRAAPQVRPPSNSRDVPAKIICPTGTQFVPGSNPPVCRR